MAHEARVDPLCCCEYFNNKNERSHLLLCCCNCVEFDLAFDRIICCKPVPSSTMTNLCNSVQDRLRIPWLYGAKRIPLEAIVAALILVIAALVSAINLYCLLITAFLLPILVQCMFKYFVKCNSRTRFLLYFIIYSCGGLFFVYENIVIKFCEISATENCVFIASSATAILCFFKVRQRANNSNMNKLTSRSDKILYSIQGKGQENVEPLIQNEESEIGIDDISECDTSTCAISKHTEHCRICQTCVVDRNFHSLWLNCCISKKNRIVYNAGMILAAIALLFGSDLILTTVCHPFEIAFGILLPDDCEDVFDDTTLKTCFLAGIYSLELGLGVLILLIYQTCFTASA